MKYNQNISGSLKSTVLTMLAFIEALPSKTLRCWENLLTVFFTIEIVNGID
jgi:hypothetical protein